MSQGNSSHPPLATVRKLRFSLVWVIPILVGVLAIYLGWKAFWNTGPTITISFETADGIVSGQTQIKNKSVILGTVRTVALSKDMSHVNVQVALSRTAAPLITDQARFWIVRPRLNGADISGLETLISGAYIAFDPGNYRKGKRQKRFMGLESPPGVRSDQPGTTYLLKTRALGSLGVGAPVFYRDVIAGEVLGYQMPANGDGDITLRIFLRKPYDRYLHSNSSFWDVSGIKVGFGPSGLDVQLQSIQALMSGGIAYGIVSPSHNQQAPAIKEDVPVPADTEFPLYVNKDEAENALFRDNVHLVTYVTSSVKGLAKGSRVTLFGLQIGTVQDVSLQIDRKAQKTRAKIVMDIQPERVFQFHRNYDVKTLGLITRSLIAGGLRASVTSDNFLFGSSLIALNFVKDSRPVAPEIENGYLVIPGQDGGMDTIMASMSTVASKIASMPLVEIGGNLNRLLAHTDDQINSPDVRKTLQALRVSMQNLSQMTRKLNKGSSPLLNQLPAMSHQLDIMLRNMNGLLASYGGDTDFHRDLQGMIVQLDQAARSLRFLSDFLTQHPSALIVGRRK